MWKIYAKDNKVYLVTNEDTDTVNEVLDMLGDNFVKLHKVIKQEGLRSGDYSTKELTTLLKRDLYNRIKERVEELGLGSVSIYTRLLFYADCDNKILVNTDAKENIS
jgi:hypothetical protein